MMGEMNVADQVLNAGAEGATREQVAAVIAALLNLGWAPAHTFAEAREMERKALTYKDGWEFERTRADAAETELRERLI